MHSLWQEIQIQASSKASSTVPSQSPKREIISLKTYIVSAINLENFNATHAKVSCTS